MPRSKKIYVVRRRTRQQPILGTFTVKHEMLTALARANLGWADVKIHEFVDGELEPWAYAGYRLWSSFKDRDELNQLIEDSSP